MMMKSSSRRALLFLGVASALIANILWRWPTTSETKPAQAQNIQQAASDIVPSVSGLSQLGAEWQKHIAALPPEARAASEARLQQEKSFFMQVILLPADERKRRMSEHLEALMNDPEIQAVMMEQKIGKFIHLDPSTREKMLRGYVGYKSQVAPH